MMSGRVPAELISSLIPETKNIKQFYTPQKGRIQEEQEEEETDTEPVTNIHTRERDPCPTQAPLSLSLLLLKNFEEPNAADNIPFGICIVGIQEQGGSI